MSAAERDVEAYVRAALALHGYAFDAAQVAAITREFARFAALAETFCEQDLPSALEPAPVFRP